RAAQWTTPPASTRTEAPPPVLVVNGEPDVRRLLHTSIESLGYEVVEVSSPGQALIALNERPFGHVFLEVGQTGASIEFAAAITEAHPSTAVVILTANPGDLIRLNGAFTILPKPIDRDGIRSSL